MICHVEMVLWLSHHHVLWVQSFEASVWVELIHLQSEYFVILPRGGDLFGGALINVFIIDFWCLITILLINAVGIEVIWMLSLLFVRLIVILHC
jgi:hypothetical protein